MTTPWYGSLALRPRRSARRRWRRLMADGSTAPVARTRWVDLRRWQVLPAAQQRVALVALAALAAALGVLTAGVVAGALLALYGGLGGLVGLRRARRRAEAASRADAVEAVSALAAELRAGQAVGTALTAATRTLDRTALLGAEAQTVAHRLDCAVELAESGGAPLAEVLDRLDDHLRAIDRVRAMATAQAAGTRVSALLLALLPVAGIGLGYLMDADPLHVLFHTHLGAGCLGIAVVLQLAGLVWSARLSRVDVHP